MEILYLLISLSLLLCCLGRPRHSPSHSPTPLHADIHTYLHVDTVQSTYVVRWNRVSSIFLNSTQSDSPYYLSKTDNGILFRIYLHGANFIVLTSSYLQWPHGLRRVSAAARMQGLRVRIPPWAWILVCCEYSVLLGSGLCVGLITRPEDSFAAKITRI